MRRGSTDATARALLRRASMVALVGPLAAAMLLLTSGTAFAQWLHTGTAPATATAASIPQVGTPTVTGTGSQATISWSAVTVTASRPVTGYVVRRYNGSGAATVACTVTAPTVSCTDPQPVTGNVTYTVAATFAGWSGPESTAVAYDVVAPSTILSTSTVANSRGWWTTSPVTVTLNASDSGSGVGSISYRVGAAAPVTVSTASTSFAVTAQGSTTITYFATDKVGNVEAQKSYTLKVDSVSPAAPTGLQVTPDTGSSATDHVTSSLQPQVVGTAEAGATVEVSVDGTLKWSTTAAANGSFAVGGTLADALTAGAHVVSVRATDAAGNTGPAATMDVVIDNTAPLAPVVISPVQNTPITVATWGVGCPAPAACGTAADSGTGGSGVQRLEYELQVSNGNNASCWNGTGFIATACDPAPRMTATGTTSWSVAVPLSSMPAGSYRLTIRAVDLAGNVSGDATRRFTK